MHGRLALTAADNSTLCPVQQTVLWKEAFVIVRELPPSNVRKGIQRRSQRHALCHSRKEKVYALAVALEKRWHQCRGRRRARGGKELWRRSETSFPNRLAAARA
jgi:hypothetical protein